MKLLKNLLTHTFEATWKVKLLTDWPIIIGNLADKVTVEKIYDDSIVLGVHDTSWLHELYMLSPVIIKTINSYLEKPYIKTVRLKQAIAVKKSAPFVPKKALDPVILKPITFTRKELSALQSIQDPELKNVLQSFLSRCHQERV